MTHIKTWFDRARPTLIPGESRRVSESWRALQAVSESLGDLESSRGSPIAHGPHSLLLLFLLSALLHLSFLLLDLLLLLLLLFTSHRTVQSLPTAKMFLASGDMPNAFQATFLKTVSPVRLSSLTRHL